MSDNEEKSYLHSVNVEVNDYRLKVKHLTEVVESLEHEIRSLREQNESLSDFNVLDWKATCEYFKDLATSYLKQNERMKVTLSWYARNRGYEAKKCLEEIHEEESKKSKN